MYGRRRNNAPYWITVKYAGVCSRCKLPIKKGESALYYPAGKTMLCNGNCCGKQEQRDMDANRQDEEVYGYRG